MCEGRADWHKSDRSRRSLVPRIALVLHSSRCCARSLTQWLAVTGVEQGLELLQQMADLSVMPDVISFNNLMAACAQVSPCVTHALRMRATLPHLGARTFP